MQQRYSTRPRGVQRRVFGHHLRKRRRCVDALVVLLTLAAMIRVPSIGVAPKNGVISPATAMALQSSAEPDFNPEVGS